MVDRSISIHQEENDSMRERKQIDAKVWAHGEDQARLSVIEDPSFTFNCTEAHRFREASQLVEQGFLTGSVQFNAALPRIQSF